MIVNAIAMETIGSQVEKNFQKDLVASHMLERSIQACLRSSNNYLYAKHCLELQRFRRRDIFSISSLSSPSSFLSSLPSLAVIIIITKVLK